ncbi:hypothetical protein J6590_093386 [Homalodisca vitripennis]|nr:hypothetical protein J6590_093386 [Homalodisca vitripennis]
MYAVSTSQYPGHTREMTHRWETKSGTRGGEGRVLELSDTISSGLFKLCELTAYRTFRFLENLSLWEQPDCGMSQLMQHLEFENSES